ncbi:Pesticin receptor precursor [Sphingomonas jeddahensis]|uniref:Pesticin receptor n=2 Tax=Sphingomonas jeddahensis TaxID=1915074 RepID=A0A1V2EST2_9SPHN|nr:Pesticin receptor precursor [Sphingomonas jeddahensis]
MCKLDGVAIRGAHRRVACSALAIVMSLVSAASAEAQAAPQIQANDADNATGDGLGDILVTARRREESEQDVSAALTVIGGGELDRRNIFNVNDLENSVPSLEIDSQFGGGQPQFRLRGVGGTDYAANNTNTVGFYIDELAYPYGAMTQNALFDVSRIEVLRGPQGTLYGRNTTGGAINVITNAPTRELSAGFDATYGSYDELALEGFLSGPLTNTLSARLAVSTNYGGAWQINRDTGEELGNRNQESARGKLRWEPNADTTIDLTGNYTRDQSDGRGLQLLNDFQSHNYPPLGVLYPADTDKRVTGWGISPYFASLIGADLDAKPFRDNEGYGATLRAQGDLGWATLTGVFGYQNFKRREFNDWDATASNEAGTFFFNDIETASGEIRLASNGSGPFNWVGGVYHANETVSGGFYSDFTESSRTGAVWSTTYDQEVKTTALFGNVEQFLTDNLSISAGARYEFETRRLDNFRSEVIAPTYQLRATASPQREMREWSGRAAIDWRFAPDVHAYASVSRGVKSGGFTTYNSGIPQQLDPYDPEKLIAYEVGLKSALLDDTLRFNLAGFYYDYRDQQLQGVIYTATSRVGRITNVPKSHIYGAEAELTWAPMRNLRITQALSYKYGEYDEFLSPDTAVQDPVTGEYVDILYNDRAGERLPLPDLDYKGSVAWTIPVGDWDFEPEVNYAYRASRYSVSDASVIPSYWLANANIGISPADMPVKVTLWVHNLFDEYIQETRNRFITARTVSTHPPRTVGVRLSYRY